MADETTLREVAEEMGLQARIMQEVGTTRYVFRLPWGSTPIEKSVRWFRLKGHLTFG